MDKYKFALALLHAPLWKKLADRTFLTTVGSAFTAFGAAVAVWQTQGVPISEKIQTTDAAFVAVVLVVTAWNHGNQKKNTAIAIAALQPDTPVAPAVQPDAPDTNTAG